MGGDVTLLGDESRSGAGDGEGTEGGRGLEVVEIRGARGEKMAAYKKIRCKIRATF